MKKHTLLLTMLFASLALTSCQDDKSSSSSSIDSVTNSSVISESESSSSSSTDPVKKSIYSNLLTAATLVNYTFNYTYDGKTVYSDVVTKNYIYSDLYQDGYIVLDSYNSSFTGSKKLVYEFKMVNDTVDVGLPYVYTSSSTGNKSIFSSCEGLDSISLFTYDAVDFTSADILKDEDGTYYTTNEYALLIFASQLNVGSYYSYFTRLDLSIDESNNVIFTIYMTSNGKQVAFAMGSITNINTTSMEKLESVKLESEALLDTHIDKFTNPITFEGDAHFYKNEEETDLTNVCTKHSTSATSYEVGATTSNIVTDSDGNMQFAYLNLDNTVSTETPTYSSGSKINYDSYFSSLDKAIESGAFRKVGDDEYKYYGVNADWILYYVAGLDADALYGIDELNLQISADGNYSLSFTFNTVSDSSQILITIQ